MFRVLILLPFFILLIAFALSNPQTTPLGLWPTDYQIEVPVSLAILTAAGVFFFLGALFVWSGTLAARSRHRRAERRAVQAGGTVTGAQGAAADFPYRDCGAQVREGVLF